MTKTEKFLEKAYKKHGDRYDYVNIGVVTDYKREKLTIICRDHGAFKQTAVGHLDYSTGCAKCKSIEKSTNMTQNTEWFIKRANEVHNSYYDYSKAIYHNSKSKVAIICPEHGAFIQSANNHLNGSKCRKCSMRFEGWSFSEWYSSALKSKHFESFKVYFIRIYNDTESFYKVGITYRKLKIRFESADKIPYKWELINYKEVKDKADREGAKNLFLIEKRFHRMYKKAKYIPNISFGGMYECFKN